MRAFEANAPPMGSKRFCGEHFFPLFLLHRRSRVDFSLVGQFVCVVCIDKIARADKIIIKIAASLAAIWEVRDAPDACLHMAVGWFRVRALLGIVVVFSRATANKNLTCAQCA